MNRSDYLALAAAPRIIHLDASSAFPIHKNVIKAVETSALIAASPGKAQYDWSHDASDEVELVRARTAEYIGARPDEIYFCYSASDAVNILLDAGLSNGQVLYSSHDHTSLTGWLNAYTGATSLLYGYDGEYALHGLTDTYDVVFACHVHHVLGAVNDIARLRGLIPSSTLVLDISQSIGRMKLNVHDMDIDAAYFSAQKIGGIAGCGVLYVRRGAKRIDTSQLRLPNSLPFQPVVALGAALDLLAQTGTFSFLHRSTCEVINALNEIPAINVTVDNKDHCDGVGIVSFAVRGVSGIEFAQLLGEYGVNVRAGDHCVNDDGVLEDMVRLSWHGYTSMNEIKMALETIRQLVAVLT